jgi:hypothetical protein
MLGFFVSTVGRLNFFFNLPEIIIEWHAIYLTISNHCGLILQRTQNFSRNARPAMRPLIGLF